MNKIIILLSLFFVFLSFSPTLYELYYAKKMPADRAFELVHNYIFDYNFYLSRIREGQPARNASRSEAGGEGKWLVTEKYYNKPHSASLFQIVYLYLGKIGGLFKLSPPAVYHISRLILGFILLLVIGKVVNNIFHGNWSLLGYLLIVTSGSWPIWVKLGNFWRFSTHWGGWSAIDSLQRITFIPHVLLGQIFLLLFIWIYSSNEVRSSRLSVSNNTMLGFAGLVAGIIFPPVLITIYTIFIITTILDFYVILNRFSVIPDLIRDPLKILKPASPAGRRGHGDNICQFGMTKIILPKIIFFIFSLPALLYLQVMFKVEPWHALSVFDIEHRSNLPYWEYVLALGPILPLGSAGLIVALVKKEKKYFPYISWVLALGLLFFIFEHVPQQSPTRFTQMLINVPLGILAAYLLHYIWNFCDKYQRSRAFVGIKGITIITIIFIILMGLSVMLSALGWLTDQVKWKAEGTWLYPVGTQLVYPLKDFMDGIEFLKINTKTNDVILAYEAAGNYIPAYAGNFVYLGHANTPDEDNKLKNAARFFKGEMSYTEAKDFLQKENIKYIYFGPQERELGKINNLLLIYSFLTSVYTNSRVTIYK